MISNTEVLEKPYTLETDDSDDHFYAKVIGDVASLAITSAYWNEIAKMALASGKKRVLVVEEIPDVISIADVHELVSELSALPVKDIRVALVDRYEDHAGVNEFGALVGENRGLTLGLFNSESDALTWLYAK